MRQKYFIKATLANGVSGYDEDFVYHLGENIHHPKISEELLELKMTTPAPALRIIKEGRTSDLTKSGKYHRCGICQEYILKGSYYYAITINGSGLDSLKFPERVHVECLEAYFQKVKIARAYRVGRRRVIPPTQPVVEIQPQAKAEEKGGTGDGLK